MSSENERTRLLGASHDDETRLGVSASAAGTTSRLVADQVFGGYRIVRELGRGGMGEVYEARDIETGRLVALKTLSQSFADRDVRDRFLREGRLAASVSHPNSVYIYGSHDIEGVPAISMELVGGGTLDDRVREGGPMPPVDAVGATLQLIDGLEAAESRGVLHRDIKPSNSFMDVTGVVKIGDYGLSLSVGSVEETRLTTAGMFLGTPAYASPEQIRGQVTDVRSDIYSVGATLYFLLTGRSPFEQPNAMQMLAAVLADLPESPRKRAPAVSEGLAEVVLRCLKKEPSGRFANYAALRSALLPFSRQALPAARRMDRFFAATIDLVVLMPLFIPAAIVARDGSIAVQLARVLFDAALQFGYYAWCEFRYGGSIGKRVQGLRVVTADGQPISFAQACARAGCYVGVLSIRQVAGLWYPAWGTGDAGFWLALLVLFSTARRATGDRGVHELLSRTRTVRTTAVWTIRRRQGSNAAKKPELRAGAQKAGEFIITERLWEAGDEALDAGWDPTLERGVWIHRVRTDSPVIPEWRQRLARQTRLRWLASRRGEDGSWDAFEAPDGGPMDVLPWNHTLSILKDLATEGERARADGSLLSPVSGARVWVGVDGMARLTEFDVPGAPRSEPIAIDNLSGTQTFLYGVALDGLGGQLTQVPLPLTVRDTLDDLGSGKYISLPALIERLDDASRSALQVSKTRRLIGLGIGAFVAAITLVVALGTAWDAYRLHQQPELEELGLFAARLQFLEDPKQSASSQWMSRHPSSRYTPEERAAFRIHIGDQFARLIADPAAWERLDPYWDDLDDKRDIAVRARAEAATAPADVRQQARVRASRILNDFTRRQLERSNFWWDQLLRIQPALGLSLFVVAVIAVATAFFARGSFVLRLLGSGIAGPDGRAASRLRAGSRTVVAWGPSLFGYALYSWVLVSMDLHAAVATSVLAVTNAITICGFILTAWRSELAMQDRIAGTRIVPK